MISILLLLILTGGIFITSNLFLEVQNTPKVFFILISMSLLLVVCFILRGGINKFVESLKSRIFLNGVVVVCLLTTIHGLLQYVGVIPSNHSAFPITGTFDNPAGFAATQAAMFPFILNICINKDNGKKQRIFSLVVGILCFVTVVLSGSRTGFLAICAAIIVALAFSNAVASFFKAHSWVWLPILIILVTILILLYFIKKDSADGRIFIWARCVDMIKNRPLFGYGVHGFRAYNMSAQAEFFRNNPDSTYEMLADNVGHPFNEYLFLTVKFGITGLILAISLLVYIVLRLFRSEKTIKVLGLSFVASMFVMSQFSYPFRYSTVWLLSFFALVPALLRNDREYAPISMLLRVIPSLILLMFLSFTVRRMYYEMKWTEISKRALIGQADRMIKYYEGMQSVMKKSPLFLYNYAAELNLLEKYDESIELLLMLVNTWNDYDVQLLLADNYASINDKEKAMLSFNLANNMIPCRFEPLYGKMWVYLNSNDSINSIDIANEIIEKPIKIRSDRVSFIVNCAQQILSNYEL